MGRMQSKVLSLFQERIDLLVDRNTRETGNPFLAPQSLQGLAEQLAEHGISTALAVETVRSMAFEAAARAVENAP